MFSWGCVFSKKLEVCFKEEGENDCRKELLVVLFFLKLKFVIKF